MKKIAIIIGTRPEAIKMAPVYLALRSQLGDIRRCFGQALNAFGIKTHIDLNVMRPNQSLSRLTSPQKYY